MVMRLPYPGPTIFKLIICDIVGLLFWGGCYYFYPENIILICGIAPVSINLLTKFVNLLLYKYHAIQTTK